MLNYIYKFLLVLVVSLTTSACQNHNYQTKHTVQFNNKYETEQKTNLKVAHIFNDNMVIQQKKAFPVWGTARRGTIVRVTLNNITNLAKSDDFGHWKLYMPDQ